MDRKPERGSGATAAGRRATPGQGHRPNSPQPRVQVPGPEVERVGAVKREFVRWPFRLTTARLRVVNPGAPTEQAFKVACRNISCSGISLLHSAYVHVGSPCTIELEHPRRGGTQIT